MKIGIVCYPTYGGSGVVATELGKALADTGRYEVHFITYDQPTRLDLFNEHLYYHKVDIRTYPLFKYPPYELALASSMVNVVKNEGLDLLHVHYAIPHASAAYMARQILRTEGIDIPVVTTLHGTDITLVGQEDSFKPVVEFSINQSDGVTCVSGNLRDQTLSLFNIQREIDVIYNFVDLQRFNRQNKNHFKKAICPNDEKLLVHISNMREVKRASDVVRMFQQVRQHVPSKLLMVGDGPERAHIEELCYQYKTCNDVRFLGKLEAIEEVLSVSDLFIMPSAQESFGLAALEAMACQVPVISTNVGGLPELNIHGQTGFLTDVGDVNAMARYAIEVLQDDNLPRFQANALKRAQEFSIENIRPQYEALYERVRGK